MTHETQRDGGRDPDALSSSDARTFHGPAPDGEGGSLFERLRSYDDPATGIRERFLTPSIGGGHTVAILSTPLGEALSTGWVFCHPFGQDQINLQPFEVPLARALAASGFPVLRFHAQGYGDSEFPREHISLGSHVRDSLEAADLLVSSTGVSQVGLFGARFGGAVAALTADELEASALAMWDPVVKGRSYMQSMVRLGVMTELVSRERSQADARDPIEVLEGTGVLDVQGFPLRVEVFREVSELDLLARLQRFRGRSLVVQVSRAATPKAGLERLVSRLSELGGRSHLEVIADKKADKFGQPRYLGRGDGTKIDSQASLARSLTLTTVSWAGADGGT